MSTNLPPIIEDVVAMHFPRMRGLRRPKVMPCDHCGVAPCDFYPCESITDPMPGPDAIALKGAEE